MSGVDTSLTHDVHLAPALLVDRLVDVLNPEVSGLSGRWTVGDRDGSGGLDRVSGHSLII